jgi:Domain of unknown function (DUF4349)
MATGRAGAGARQRATWMVAALLLAAVVVGCSSGGRSSSGSAGGVARSAPAAGPAAPAAGGSAKATAPGVQLADLENRIVRTATVDLEVGRGRLNAVIDQATVVVASRYKGLYVGSNTSVPGSGAAHGEVTFRVPVLAFEAALRDLKQLGTYRGEKSATDDVTNQYIDLSGQLKAWRAQEKVYLQLLDRARSISDVVTVQTQLQQVQSNIQRLQGQVDFLDQSSSFSTIVLVLSEPGAAPAGAKARNRFVRAWSMAVEGLAVVGAALLVTVVWLVPFAALGGLALLIARVLRRSRVLPAPGGAPTPPAA